jgi:type IV pilus assembly protein PilW
MRSGVTQTTAARALAVRTRQRGFSLVELMVAMTLSLILLSGVIAIFISSRATYETTDRLSRIQESGRFAIDSLVRDLRATGFVGCSQLPPLTNILNNTGNVLWNFARPVEGFDGQTSAWAPSIDTTVISSPSPIAATDILVVRIPRPGTQMVRLTTSMAATNDPVTVDTDLQAQFNVGDIVMINDCNARTVFQVTAKNANVLQHTATGTAPGNNVDDLNYAYASINPQGGGEAIPMQTVIYYLARRNGAPATSAPSLWRRVGSTAAEELVEGVENLQLAYGQTTGTNMVSYRKADAITDWNAVVSVNIALLVRSLSEYGTDRDQVSYTLISSALGAQVPAPNDRHLRQVFATTVSLRNQTL